MSRRLRFQVAAAAVLTVAAASSAVAFSFDALVGQWFTELEEKSTFRGEPYTLRKQIEDNRSDGTKTATFRFYDNCRYVGELVNELDWGVDTTNGRRVYWTQCRVIIEGGARFPCSSISLYDLTDVTAKMLKYTSRDSGTAYVMTRVDADFKIPPSACLSSAPRPIPVQSRPVLLK